MKTIHRNDISNLPTKKYPSIGANQLGNNNRKLIQLVARILCLGIFIGLATYGILFAWSWSISNNKVLPETFTELYFDDNIHLPSTVIPRHPYLFQFTLHNLEGKDMEYAYDVYVETGHNKLIFDKGIVFVKENEYKTIQERFAATSDLPKSEITVDLINKNQQIDFWIKGPV